MVEYLPPAPAASGPSQEWSTKYVKSMSGIFKIVEMVLSFIMFICSAYRGIGWSSFVGIAGLIQVFIFFLLHILNYFPDSIIGFIIELIVYAVFTLFFFGAGINCAVVAAWDGKYIKDTHPGAYTASIVATLFCFACFVVWGIDTVLQLLAVLTRKRQQPTAPAQPAGPPPT